MAGVQVVWKGIPRKVIMLQEPPGLERSLGRATRWAVVGAGVGAFGLLVPQVGPSGREAFVLIHLVALVAVGLAVTWDLDRFLAESWFEGATPVSRRFGAAASQVALATGVVALVTLASSAAFRYDPSLQFLQLLSALDIAWAAAATMIGWTWLRGRGAGIAAGVAVGVFCTWSIWRYVDAVGFSAEGGWIVDGAALWRFVLPYDMAAAVVALLSLWAGARHQPTEQRSPQS